MARYYMLFKMSSAKYARHVAVRTIFVMFDKEFCGMNRICHNLYLHPTASLYLGEIQAKLSFIFFVLRKFHIYHLHFKI